MNKYIKEIDRFPELYMVIATLFLTLFSTLSRIDLPLSIMIFGRFFIPLLVVGSRRLLDLSTLKSYIKDMTWIDFSRSIFVVGSQYAFFYCVRHTSLFNANALLNTAPAFILIIYFFYNRSFSQNKLWGVILGFIGVVFILKPQPGAINLALPIGILAGFCWAMSNFTQSLMLEKHSNEKCMFFYYFHGSVLSFLILAFSFKRAWIGNYLHMDKMAMLLVFAMCTLGFQYFSGRAYKIRSAFHLAPYLYLTILFSWMVDYFILHVHSPISSIIGALLIFSGTLLSRVSVPLGYWLLPKAKID